MPVMMHVCVDLDDQPRFLCACSWLNRSSKTWAPVFGDGSAEPAEHTPIHSYDHPGNYTASVREAGGKNGHRHVRHPGLWSGQVTWRVCLPPALRAYPISSKVMP